jgi:YD repeat-containing protein
MATVHIRDIMKWLAASGQKDAEPWSGEFFFEIRFDEDTSPVTDDAEFAGRVITADAPQGTVTITFDDHGQLRSIDVS